MSRREPPIQPSRSGNVSSAQARRGNAISHKQEQQARESREEAARAQLLLSDQQGAIHTERDYERTWRAKQYQILEDADDNTRAKVLDLSLNQAYSVRFTGNGRHMVMGGSKGHLAVVDTLRSRLITEVNLNESARHTGNVETVHDVCALHNESMFAVAQKKYVYVYDHTGTEVHQLRTHVEPRKLEFLPYHFLLASVGRSSKLVYEDMSTGTLVASLRTKMGPCSVLAQNPHTAVLATGHGCGVVAMWAPTNGDALVKVLCHSAPITAVQFDPTGLKMATCSLDEKINIWDCRMLGTRLNQYHVPAPQVGTALAVSQTGLLCVGTSQDRVTVWRDVFGAEKQKDPYMSHRCPSQVKSLHFRPFEDVLGIGHASGVQTIIIPGAGEANYDGFEHNPFERKNQRREAEVRRLLDKLPADSIGLGTIGEVFEAGENKAEDALIKHRLTTTKEKKRKIKLQQQQGGDVQESREHDEGVLQEAAAAEEKAKRERKKMKGRGKIGSRLKTKHRNIITQEREIRRAAEDNKPKQQQEEQDRQDSAAPRAAGSVALDRLAKKKPRRE